MVSILELEEPGRLKTFNEKDCSFAGVFSADINKFVETHGETSYPWSYLSLTACMTAKIRLVYYFNFRKPITPEEQESIYAEIRRLGQRNVPTWVHNHDYYFQWGYESLKDVLGEYLDDLWEEIENDNRLAEW